MAAGAADAADSQITRPEAGMWGRAAQEVAQEVLMTTAGFIGLGSQGAGMAQRIIEQGVPTTPATTR